MTVSLDAGGLGGFKHLQIRSSRAIGNIGDRGEVRITLAPAKTFSAYRLPTLHLPDGRFLLSILMPVDHVMEMAAASAMTVKIDPAMSFTLAVDGPVAMQKLDACQDKLLRSWGIDPAEARRKPSQASVPVTEPALWISNDDYPAAAVRDHLTGEVAVIWRIGPDGLVHDCHVTESSNHPSLDDATCDLLTRNGRYTPALDENGKPISTYSTRRVAWRLP